MFPKLHELTFHHSHFKMSKDFTGHQFSKTDFLAHFHVLYSKVFHLSLDSFLLFLVY